MQLKIELKQLISILNWLFILFPISFIAGNLIVTFHFLIFILLGLIYLKKKNIKLEYDLLLFIFFLFSLILIISSVFNDINIKKSFFYLRFLIFYYISFHLFKEKKFDTNKIFFFLRDICIHNLFRCNYSKYFWLQYCWFEEC